MGINRKVRNANPLEYDGIKFKSRVEVSIYKLLRTRSIEAKYEEKTFILSPSIRPTVPFYNRTEKAGFHSIMSPISNITYTPDFTFMYNNILVIIEVKGFENDVFPVKRNLFRKLLETLDTYCMFFEIRTQKEMLKALEIIKMESPLIQKIRANINHLPEKDVAIAHKYLSQRDFDSLQDLVDSAIMKVERSRTSNAKPELQERYKNIDIFKLQEMSLAVTEYRNKL
jgi:hypothetical protein